MTASNSHLFTKVQKKIPPKNRRLRSYGSRHAGPNGFQSAAHHLNEEFGLQPPRERSTSRVVRHCVVEIYIYIESLATLPEIHLKNHSCPRSFSKCNRLAKTQRALEKYSMWSERWLPSPWNIKKGLLQCSIDEKTSVEKENDYCKNEIRPLWSKDSLHDKFFSKLFGLHVAPAFCKNIMHTPRSPKLKKRKLIIRVCHNHLKQPLKK